MKTTIQQLIHFIKNDMMQSSYTKEQIIELLQYKLDEEKEQLENAFSRGNPKEKDNFYVSSHFRTYYKETYKHD